MFGVVKTKTLGNRPPMAGAAASEKRQCLEGHQSAIGWPAGSPPHVDRALPRGVDLTPCPLPCITFPSLGYGTLLVAGRGR